MGEMTEFDVAWAEFKQAMADRPSARLLMRFVDWLIDRLNRFLGAGK